MPVAPDIYTEDYNCISRGYVLPGISSIRKYIMERFYDTVYDTLLFQETEMIDVVRFSSR